METCYLKDLLIEKYNFKNNEYLAKYVELLIANANREQEIHRTQRHHMIPIYYYYVKRNIHNRYQAEKLSKEDNNVTINLLQSDHILAHIYLDKILSDDLMKLKNFYALQRMLKAVGNEISIDEITQLKNLSEFQELYESSRHLCSKYNKQKKSVDPDTWQKHTDIMQSEEIRDKISESMRDVRINEEKLTMHKDRTTKRIPFDLVASYLAEGWQQGPSSSVINFYDGEHIVVYSKEEVRYILPQELSEYKKSGWRFSPAGFPAHMHKNSAKKRNIRAKTPSIKKSGKKSRTPSNRDQKRIRLHKDDRETTIWSEYLDEYLSDGWLIGGKPGRMTDKQKLALANSHKNISDIFRAEQSDRLKNFYQNNPDWETKSKHPVIIENPETGEILQFQSRIDFCNKTDIPTYIATAGIVKRWIDIGYINRKSSIYNGWKISN